MAVLEMPVLRPRGSSRGTRLCRAKKCGPWGWLWVPVAKAMGIGGIAQGGWAGGGWQVSRELRGRPALVGQVEKAQELSTVMGKHSKEDGNQSCTFRAAVGRE